MLLSIILPTFNGARFLATQIDSILEQTVDDIELLVIDDGSTDNTVAIVKDFAKRDRRISVLPSTGNRGQRRRIVELLGEASGEFVAIADQDDIWDRDRNARLLAAIGQNGLALGRSQLIDHKGVDLGKTVLDAFDVDPQTIGPLGALFVPFVSAHAALVRRTCINLGAFYGVLPFDRALGLEAFFSTGLVYVDDAIVRHRIHGGNQVNASVADDRDRRKFISRHRLRESLGFLQPGRLWFAQTLDQLGRSDVLASATRAHFAYLAGMCWHIWFGTGHGARSLEAEFHERLDVLASDANDLAFFTKRLHSVSSGRFAPVNLRLGWGYYRKRG